MNAMKILLVDDSKSARYALRLQLQRHGAVVETADSAEAALERIKEDPPDAIFMDHTMPGMNGFEALEVLKSAPTTAHLPVVMCSSNEDPEFIAQARRKGALDILSKATAHDKLPALLSRLNQSISTLKTAAAKMESAAGSPPGPSISDSVTDSTPAHLEERVRTLIEPILKSFEERLTAQVTADTEKTLLAGYAEEMERLQQQFVHTQDKQTQLTTDTEKKLLAVYAEEVERMQQQFVHAQDEQAQVATNIEKQLLTRFQEEAKRLQQHVIHAQGEQAQLTTNRLANDLLPQLVQEQVAKGQENLMQAVKAQIAQDRQQVARMVQEMIDARVDQLAEEPAFMRRVLEATEATAANSAEQFVKRQAHETTEAIAAEQAREIADSLIADSRTSPSIMYLLAAGAAGIGIAAAAIVYYLVR